MLGTQDYTVNSGHTNKLRSMLASRKKICLDCAGDDPALVIEIVKLAMPEMAQRLEAGVK